MPDPMLTIQQLYEQTRRLVKRGLGSRAVMIVGDEDDNGTNCWPAGMKIVTVQEVDGPRKRALVFSKLEPTEMTS